MLTLREQGTRIKKRSDLFRSLLQQLDSKLSEQNAQDDKASNR
jgi:hypothetical protein